MKDLMNLLEKHVDFHFVLALIAIFGTAGSLYLQLNQANTEFETLNASMYSVVKNKGNDSREGMFFDQELEKIEQSLNDLNLN